MEKLDNMFIHVDEENVNGGGVAGGAFGACMGFTAGAIVGAYHVCTGSEPAQMGRDLVTGTLAGAYIGASAIPV